MHTFDIDIYLISLKIYLFYQVTMKYPHFFPVTRKCNNPQTRFKMEKTYQSRCMAENTKIIEEIVTLRQKQAELLGYENHAAYIQVGITGT